MKEKINIIYERLRAAYPEAKCELQYSTPFELLVAVILSAQCTDKRVNQVTEKLYKVYHTPEQFAAMTPEQLEPWIFSCGFYHNKSANIIQAAKSIVEDFGGTVPSTMEELMKLSGVGRKTASVVYAVAFGGQAMPVDTHVFRVSRRIGLSDGKNVLEVERDLRAIIPENRLSDMHHYFIFHGRYTCSARKPKCAECVIADLCRYYNELEG